MSDWISDMGGLALGSRMRRISDHLSGEVAKVYKALGIELNPRHFPVLSLLYSEGKNGLSVTDISARLKKTHVAISSTVKSLESQGYCLKKNHKKDDRISLIVLTPKAKKLIDETLLYVWQVIREETDSRLTDIHGDFWQVVEQTENAIHKESLSKNILDALRDKA